MSADQMIDVLWAVGLMLLVLIVLISRRARRHGGAMRAGIVGAVYDMHNRDKQKALEIIVEGKAAERRPEYPDGDLPQLEKPGTRGKGSSRAPNS